MAREEWRAAPGYEGLYEVSSIGRVRRLDSQVRTATGSRLWRGGIRAAIKSAGNGYIQARFSKFGKAKTLCVHALVCEAFHGPPPTPEHQVAHRDGSRDNNAADNLRWATAAENAADRKVHGTERQGEQIYHVAKLTESDVRSIRARYRPGYGGLCGLANEYNVTRANILSIVKRRNWKHI